MSWHTAIPHPLFYQIVISPLCLRHVPYPHRPFPCGGGAVADDFAINLRVVAFEWVVLLRPSPPLCLRNVPCPHRPFPCGGGTVEAVFAINLHVITFGWVVLLRPSLPLCLRHVPCPHRPFPCDGGAMADGDTTNPLGVVLSIARGCRR